MLEPPDVVRVGPLRYEVVLDRRAIDSLDRTANGTTCHEQERIYLDPGNTPNAIRVTLLHEVLHSVWWLGGRQEGKVTEEQALRILAAPLLDTLRRNPALVNYLLMES